MTTLTYKTRVAYTEDKKGRPIAYRVSYQQMRNFRISLEKAAELVAEGAVVQPYQKFEKF